MDAVIISNNTLLPASLSERYQIIPVSGAPIDVLIRARDEIHQGRKLLTHPLSGNFRPNESPYMSVAVSCFVYDKTDVTSLITIENCIAMMKAGMEARPDKQWDEVVLKDFGIVDSDMLKSALESN